MPDSRVSGHERDIPRPTVARASALELPVGFRVELSLLQRLGQNQPLLGDLGRERPQAVARSCRTHTQGTPNGSIKLVRSGADFYISGDDRHLEDRRCPPCLRGARF